LPIAAGVAGVTGLASAYTARKDIVTEQRGKPWEQIMRERAAKPDSEKGLYNTTKNAIKKWWNRDTENMPENKPAAEKKSTLASFTATRTLTFTTRDLKFTIKNAPASVGARRMTLWGALSGSWARGETERIARDKHITRENGSRRESRATVTTAPTTTLRRMPTPHASSVSMPWTI